jgi:hypothetical protein
MIRTLIGICVGALLGILALATYAAVEGFTRGGELLARPTLAAGPYAACLTAFVAVAYFWWLAGGIGAWIGGLIGLGFAAVHYWQKDNNLH